MAKGTLNPRPTEADPRVRRGYFECRYGQLHVHNAIPPGGGFEEGTPVLCVHHTGGTGREFERFLLLSGRDRSVYAPDTPGFGESDAPLARATVADYAAAIGDFLESMRFRQIDLLGYQAGALLAAEIAINRPKQVRRVVMVSVPMLADNERDASRRPPVQSADDGSHLAADWRRTGEWYGSGVPVEVRTRAFAEKLKCGIHSAWALSAAHQYASRERLALVTQPVLVLRPRDEYWDATGRVREVLPRARFAELPDHGSGIFAAAPEVVFGLTKDFLRG